jgi:hypothetical protein
MNHADPSVARAPQVPVADALGALLDGLAPEPLVGRRLRLPSAGPA